MPPGAGEKKGKEREKGDGKAQERPLEKGDKLTKDKVEKAPFPIGNKPQEKVVPNVYRVDDDMFSAGPYYNVRAGRK